MKYLLLYACMSVPAITISGCCLCFQAQPIGKEAELRYTSRWGTEDEWAKQVISAKYEDENALFIIGSLLHESRRRRIDPPRIRCVMRDTRPTSVARLSEWNNEDMIAYFLGVRDDPKRAPWEYELAADLVKFGLTATDQPLGHFIHSLTYNRSSGSYGFGTLNWSRAGRKLTIGFPDVVCRNGRFQRRSYQIPADVSWQFPEQSCDRIPGHRISCDFDDETGILVLVGEVEQMAIYESILDAIGARRIRAVDGCQE